MMPAPALLLLSSLGAPPLPALRAAPSQDPHTQAPPTRQLGPRRLRAVFLDLLGRPPFRAEAELWQGRGLHELLDELVGCEEFWRQWQEEQLYHFLLIENFRPRGGRADELPAELAGGALDVREAIHRIALSPSFDLRNPGADTFVTVVMEQLDGLEVQARRGELETAKRIYDGKRGLFLGSTASSQSDLVRIAVEHPLFARTFVEREHRRILKHEPEARDLARFARELHRDPSIYPELVRGWLESDAYERRLEQHPVLPNRLFVRALFVDLLDRLPQPEEERRMRSALDGLSDPGPLRSVLVRLLLDSGAAPLPPREEIRDPSGWIAGLFRRWLGREASRGELAAFGRAFADPACRPQTVAYALLSHPDYARF